MNMDGRSHNERAAIYQLFALADEWGYGNFICLLQARWGEKLKEKWGIGDGSPHKFAGFAYEPDDDDKKGGNQ